jgi:hypothetical protein
LTSIFNAPETTTDPKQKFLEESGLAYVFGTNLLKEEKIKFVGELNFDANQLVVNPASEESKDHVYFVI